MLVNEYTVNIIIITFCIHTVTKEPTRLNATFKSNSTHVNITVTWESPHRSTPGTPLSGYVIYYQPKGGEINSVNVSNKETEKYLLEGLQRGVTYNISIVAWSYFRLPSLPVGPITEIPGM